VFAAPAGATRKSGAPLVLTKQNITTLFKLSQTDAAARLGVSITSLKKVCRKMGIARWPFNRRLGLVKSLFDQNLLETTRHDSEAELATSDHGLADCHSAYSTVCASKLQKTTKPRTEATDSKTTSDYTVTPPQTWAKSANVYININANSDDGSSLSELAAHEEFMQNTDTQSSSDLLRFCPSTTPSHFPGCIPSVTTATTCASEFAESCRKSFFKARNLDIDDDLRLDHSPGFKLPCQQAQHCMMKSDLSPRFDQLTLSQIGQGNSRALHEYMITEEFDGDLQTSAVVEESSDDLHWLVCATSPLINEDSFITSQNTTLIPASSTLSYLQSCDLPVPSTPLLQNVSSAEGQLKLWASTLRPCQSQPEWMLLWLHLNAV